MNARKTSTLSSRHALETGLTPNAPVTPSPWLGGAGGPELDGLLAVSIDRLAEMTSLGRTFIYDEIKHGRLRLTKKGRRSVILIEDAKAWLRGDPCRRTAGGEASDRV